MTTSSYVKKRKLHWFKKTYRAPWLWAQVSQVRGKGLMSPPLLTCNFCNLFLILGIRLLWVHIGKIRHNCISQSLVNSHSAVKWYDTYDTIFLLFQLFICQPADVYILKIIDVTIYLLISSKGRKINNAMQWNKHKNDIFQLNQINQMLKLSTQIISLVI